MTIPSLVLACTSPAPVLIVGARVSAGEVSIASRQPLPGISESLREVGFAGGVDELIRLPPREGLPSVAVIGLPEQIDARALRYAAGSAVRQLHGVASVCIDLPFDGDDELRAILEGAALGSYDFTAYRSASSAGVKTALSSIEVHGQAQTPASILRRVRAVADAVSLVKDLVNAPPIDLYPQTFAEAAERSAADLPVAVTVWDETALADEGFGGILGVGQGSARPPRLVKVSYSPVGADRHLALVGKGITFDSGGLSLKTPTGMVGAKFDMTGAATVLGVTLAAAQLALPVRVTAWLCLAENMPSGSAIRPNDVLRIRGGRTVEVLNTDAEGRLVLADGLVAASEERPDAIIDVATLTGAAVVALGTRYAGVMGEDALVSDVLRAAESEGELLWPMPLPAELRATLTSDVADLANADPGNTAGGMLLAGVFLHEFIGRTSETTEAPRIPWAHLDIAGPAMAPASPYGFIGKGATAVTVRALIRLVEDFSARPGDR